MNEIPEDVESLYGALRLVVLSVKGGSNGPATLIAGSTRVLNTRVVEIFAKHGSMEMNTHDAWADGSCLHMLPCFVVHYNLTLMTHSQKVPLGYTNQKYESKILANQSSRGKIEKCDQALRKVSVGGGITEMTRPVVQR